MNEILAGGCVAVVAFALALLWDLAKFRRDRRARQNTAIVGFVEEMSANYGAAENNLTLLAIEQRDIAGDESKALLNPLSSLEAGAWAIARLDLPRALLGDHDLVRRLQIINRNTVDINGLIQSRETFRIQHLSGRDQVLVDGLTKYATVLMHLLRDLKQRMAEARREVEPYVATPESRRDGFRLILTIERRRS